MTEPTHKARMLAGEGYLADDPELTALRDRAQLLLARFNATTPVTSDADERRALLDELLGAMGAESTILPPFRCDYGFTITIGERSFVNFGAVFLDEAPVTIGTEVLIASNVQLLTATHPVDPVPRRAGIELAKPITLADGVWLGGGVIVGPGVTIGENTAVGAGSVVVRDLPPNVVAVGNPARVVRAL